MIHKKKCIEDDMGYNDGYDEDENVKVDNVKVKVGKVEDNVNYKVCEVKDNKEDEDENVEDIDYEFCK